MEEIDLCWRLRSQGRGIVCIPQSVVFHVGAATLKKENPRKTFLNFRNNLLMLYKNLPDSDLKRVMFIRGLLDGVAALVFLLKGEKEAARAVLQARREFKRIRPDFAASRSENRSRAVTDAIPEKVKYSILWKFHVERKKVFS
jgi:GT2 family glycosyltransferase